MYRVKARQWRKNAILRDKPTDWSISKRYQYIGNEGDAVRGSEWAAKVYLPWLHLLLLDMFLYVHGGTSLRYCETVKKVKGYFYAFAAFEILYVFSSYAFYVF
jgi:hypothetical protein